MAYLALDKTFHHAKGLAARIQEVPTFRQYLSERAALVAAAAAVFLLVSVSCAAATVIFLADRHPLLALPGLVLAMAVLLGGLFVQGYLLLAWLEDRSLAQALGRSRRKRFDFGRPPPVPWALAAAFLFVPLAMLAALSGLAALVLILLAITVPVLFAAFDH